MKPLQEEQRTSAQNRALHLWCRMLSDEYNNRGYTIDDVLKNITMDMFWSMESVKEVLIKHITKRMFGKRSTTELIKSGEIDKIVDVMTKFNAKMDIDYIPFPSLEKDDE